ncbi:MAG: response regulator transcription factor [Elusimicrobiota bacterium]|nr:response regulator transcription factor [Elusimicrobiota bacterium]MDH5661649.1 response regulator transcription factor [Elusimicrobiota bacterium]
MAKQKILVVDDEPDLVELVKDVLERNNYWVISARNADIAIKKVRVSKPDLIILDLNLPGIGGIEVCRILKRDKKTSSIPIIMLTVKSTETDKIAGLEAGADDYMTKPFSTAELVARTRAVLRRILYAGEPGEVLAAGDIRLDSTEHMVYVADEQIDLTPKEFNLLYLLMKKRGKVLSRTFLIENIWGYEYLGGTRTVDVHVRHLREKMGKEGKKIETVEGVGYKFVEEE